MTFLFVAVLLYFLPTIIGHGKGNAAGIFIVNLLFGWTGIGWFIALLWACASEPRVSTVLVPAGSSPYFCRCGARTSGRALLLGVRPAHVTVRSRTSGVPCTT